MAKASLNLTRVFFLFLALLALTNSVYALPFTIIPKAGTSLPVIVTPGGSVTAYYTVANNTSSQRNNNFVKYLPPNTVQVTSGGTFPNTCGAKFNLAAVGKPGSNCTLQLKVSGPVNGNDPDPHHHLFVCFPGGTTCAGTNFPLNVISQPKTMTNLVISPSTATIAIGLTQQYTATATFNDGSTQNVTSTATWNSSNPAIASISASGLATGLIIGSTNITATFNSVTSSPATLIVSGALLQSISITPTTSTIIASRTQQYTAIGQFSDGSSQNITASATWNSSNPTIASIAPGGVATGLATGTTNISASLNAITSNNAVLNVNLVAYVPSGISGQVIQCPINADGRFGDCILAKSGFSGPILIKLHPTNGSLYVLNNNNGASFVSFCPLNSSGTVGVCQTAVSGLSDSFGFTFNAIGTRFYATNNADDRVVLCLVGSNGKFNSCVNTLTNIDGVAGITLNPAGTIAYIANEDGASVFKCPVLNANGNLGPCTNMPVVGTFSPHSVTFNATGTRVYMANFLGNTITKCNVTNTGDFTGCSNTANLFLGANDLVFNRDFTRAYIANLLGNTISVCDVNNTTGDLTGCRDAGGNGFTAPGSLVIP